MRVDDSSSHFFFPGSISLQMFMFDIYTITEYGVKHDFTLLYQMLDGEDFENLIAQILHDRSDKRFIPKEDYVLNMFIEHEKKRRASYE